MHSGKSGIAPALIQVMTICKILEGILPKESVRGAPPPDKKLLEYHFVFACVWAFGGCMMVDKVRSRHAFLGLCCCLPWSHFRWTSGEAVGR